MQSPLDNRDVLYGFDMHGRSEPIRMMYHMGGEKFEDHRVEWNDWEPKYKADMPLGALPVLKASCGTINQSVVIARHVARKLGFMGDDSWEQTLHDVVQENLSEASQFVDFLFVKKVHGSPDPPKNMEETKGFCLKVLTLIQGLAEKRGKKYIVSDKIGLADIWLYATLQYWKMLMPNITDSSKWLKDYEEKLESVEGIKSYLEQRPENKLPEEIKKKLMVEE